MHMLCSEIQIFNYSSKQYLSNADDRLWTVDKIINEKDQ